jgi:hypothetical protein
MNVFFALLGPERTAIGLVRIRQASGLVEQYDDVAAWRSPALAASSRAPDPGPCPPRRTHRLLQNDDPASVEAGSFNSSAFGTVDQIDFPRLLRIFEVWPPRKRSATMAMIAIRARMSAYSARP